MASRRTRVTLSIPWDDEENDHPAQWDYDTLMDLRPDDNLVGALVVDFEEVDDQGNLRPV